MADKKHFLEKPAAIFGILLCLGLALSGYFVSQTLLNSKGAHNTVYVKGLSERNVISNIAEWNINFTLKGDTDKDVKKMYKEADDFTTKVISELLKNGISENEISKGMYNYNEIDLTRYNNNVTKKRLEKTLTGSIVIKTKDVKLPNRIADKVNSYVSNNITINNNVSYRFTELNKIKPEMVQEANKNARISADQFAKDADVKIGSLQQASQGQFVIRDIGSSYGSDKSIEKVVRVTTNVTYYIED